MSSARSARLRKPNIDKRIARNRQLADQNDERLSSIRFAPANAGDRPRSMVMSVPNTFESPDSQTIVGASYDESKRTMSITFKRALVKGGGLPIYDYTGVSPELWADFAAAESKGNFFAEFIRPQYLGRLREAAPK